MLITSLIIATLLWAALTWYLAVTDFGYSSAKRNLAGYALSGGISFVICFGGWSIVAGLFWLVQYLIELV